MQDQYVGDIGDFGKYGLLRHLTGMREDAKPRLTRCLGRGLVPLPGLPNTYAPKPRDRDCDPELYWSLRERLQCPHEWDSTS